MPGPKSPAATSQPTTSTGSPWAALRDTVGIVSAGKTWLDLRQALLVIMGLDDAELARHGIRLIKLGALLSARP